jgi:hypothetical protein
MMGGIGVICGQLSIDEELSMRKRCFAAVCAVLVAAVLGAQEGGGLLSAGDLEKYSSYFLNDNGSISRKYIREAETDNYGKIASLGGDSVRDVDTPLEIALLSTCAGVADIRPAEAVTMLGSAKQADLKLGAAVYQEMQVLRFLGDTAAAGRHEAILQFITGRGNVSRAEIEAYLRSGIAGVVDAEFKDITIAANTKTAIKQAISGFFLTPNQTNYNGLKRYKYMRRRDYDFLIAKAEEDRGNQLKDAEYFQARGDAALAESFRESAESSRNSANTMKTARAYFDTLQVISPALAKVIQESW